MDDLKVAPCERKAALYAVQHWHYSGTLPPGKLVCYGVWESGKFIGAVVFGRGASNSMLNRYGLTQLEGCELVRVALTDHIAPVSQIVSVSLHRLRVDNPGLRLVVSFADPAQGHIGGIYKAGNWVYAGKSEQGTAYLAPDGRMLHSRQVSTNGWRVQFGTARRMPKASDCKKIALPGKHRYLYPLDRAMRRQVSKLAQPYPTAETPLCESGIDGDPAAALVAGAGSTPATRSTYKPSA